MKYFLIALGIILVGVGGYFDYQSLVQERVLSGAGNPAVSVSTEGTSSTQYKLYTNNELGFSFSIPSDWIATETRRLGVFTISSPDFAYEDRSIRDEGDNLVVATGATFMIVGPKWLSLPIQDPLAYVEFKESTGDDCANCSSTERIMLGGVVALKTVATGYTGINKEKPIMVVIDFEHNTQGYAISYESAKISDKDLQIIAHAIESFIFLK